MAYTTEYKRRRRVAESIGEPAKKIKGSRIEHAAAQESREINAAVIAGTYVNKKQRFGPTPRMQHFSPTQERMLKVVATPYMSYEEAHQL